MIQRRLVALLLTVFLAIPTLSGIAQTHPLEAELREEQPGVQASVWRMYVHPDADAESTTSAEEMATLSPITFDITVTSFDTSDKAAAYFDVLADLPFDFEFDPGQGLVSQNQANRSNDTQSIYRLRLGQGDERTQGFEQVLLQEDELVFTLMFEWRAVYQDGTEAPDNLAVPDAIEPLAEQIAAGEPSPDPVMFAEDGSSTGELWGYMPADGDPLLMDLVATEDISIFPPTDGLGMPETMPVDQLPGIESAVFRRYIPIDAGAEIPDLGPLELSVYRFTSSEQATEAYDLLMGNFSDEIRFQSGIEGNNLVTAELAGVGERADQMRVEALSLEQGYRSQEYLLTLHDTYVFVVMTVTGGPQTMAGTPVAISLSSAAAINLAMSLVANGEPSADDAVFAEDGTSTGGDWALMPVAGDPLLQGLVATMDQQLYPADNPGS